MKTYRDREGFQGGRWGGGEGGVLPQTFGSSVQPTSQNPCRMILYKSPKSVISSTLYLTLPNIWYPIKLQLIWLLKKVTKIYCSLYTRKLTKIAESLILVSDERQSVMSEHKNIINIKY